MSAIEYKVSRLGNETESSAVSQEERLNPRPRGGVEVSLPLLSSSYLGLMKKRRTHFSGVLFQSMTLLSSVVIFLLIFLSCPYASNAAGGDCMSGSTIECFECNSWEDPRCHDPFNYTLHKHDMPKIRICGGCCVKMVQFLGTEHYQVKRTCTDDFEVNFFMVNHACMTEGHRHGHMCFCEEDECNHAKSKLQPPSLIITLLAPAMLLLYLSVPRIQNLFPFYANLS